MSIAPDHPIRTLCFFVEGDVDERTRAAVMEFVARLEPTRNWLKGPPQFVDYVDEAEDHSKGDMDVEVVGGCIDTYSELPPWKLTRDQSIQELDEVSALVDALCAFSREQHLSWRLQLGDTWVGYIEDGVKDRTLDQGFLGEWRRCLGL